LGLVQLEGQNFFNTIRHKLGWGLDKRNWNEPYLACSK
jgi:hypothetical protein